MYNYPVLECLIAFAIVFSISFLFSKSNRNDGAAASPKGVACPLRHHAPNATPRSSSLGVACKPQLPPLVASPGLSRGPRSRLRMQKASVIR